MKNETEYWAHSISDPLVREDISDMSESCQGNRDRELSEF